MKQKGNFQAYRNYLQLITYLFEKNFSHSVFYYAFYHGTVVNWNSLMLAHTTGSMADL